MSVFHHQPSMHSVERNQSLTTKIGHVFTEGVTRMRTFSATLRIAVFNPSRTRLKHDVDGVAIGDTIATNEVKHLQGNNAQRALDIIQQLLDGGAIDIDRIPSVLEVMAILSASSKRFPSSFFIDISPPVDSGGYELSTRTGRHTDVFLKTYLNQKVAIRRIRTHAWTLPSIERQTAQHKLYVACLQWRQFHHPNIVPLLGLVRGTYIPTLVLPWRERGNIRQHLRSVEIEPSVDQRMKWILDVARGLLYLHQGGRIHGDLRGEKIMISDEDIAQLTDVVLSPFHEYWPEDVALGRELTYRWTAPEVLNGSPRSKFSDVFAFGLVGVEIFTGVVPFSGVSSHMAGGMILQGDHPSKPVTMPDKLWECLKECWNVEPLDRPTMVVIFDDLNGIKSEDLFE